MSPPRAILYAVLVHGILGSFGELLGMMFNKIAVPLRSFYNHSIEEHYGVYLDPASLSLVSSLLTNANILGSLISTLVFVPQIDVWGRKPVAVYFRSVICLLASAFYIAAKFLSSVELFALGQFTNGLNKPLKVAVAKLYLAECSPNEYRGFTAQAISTATTFATIFGTVLMFPGLFGTEDKWHLIPVFAILIIIVFCATGSRFPESPKYLHLRKESKTKITQVIHEYQGENADLDSILDSFDKEEELVHSNSFREIWANETLRHVIILVIVATVWPIISVPEILGFYGISLKVNFGFSNEGALFFDTMELALSIPFLVLMPILFERIGRRPLLLTCCFLNILIAICIFTAKFSTDLYGPSSVTIYLTVAYSIMNSVCTACGFSIFYIILIADLLPISSKAIVTQTCLAINFCSALPVTFLYPIAYSYFGAFVFLPFLFFQCLFLLYFWYNLPETRMNSVYSNLVSLEGHIRSRANSIWNPIMLGSYDLAPRSRAASLYQPLITSMETQRTYSTLSLG
uniref:Major facilitator superfamily (MFS) profile domain-containing protein n=1 Tax=Acrobeloides nanus TaxID=290746 RepID=A0A914DNJ6_9BILA